MKKLMVTEVFVFTAMALICFVFKCMFRDDIDSVLLLHNIGIFCGIKATGVLLDILSEKEHTHSGIRLKMSTIALAVLLPFALSRTWTGLYIFAGSIYGAAIVFIFDLAVFVLCRTIRFVRKKTTAD
ncbi:MAG: hypothetical protein J6X56_11445 [Ruminococcus sp.]|nr:hypothetical protein [Ruminococcus sp.]